jgi:hypothetical protein
MGDSRLITKVSARSTKSQALELTSKCLALIEPVFGGVADVHY